MATAVTAPQTAAASRRTTSSRNAERGLVRTPRLR